MKQRIIEFWVMVTADKRKAAVLGVLLLVAVVMWLRMVMVSGGPSAAKASSIARATAQEFENKSDSSDGAGGYERLPIVNIPPVAPLKRDLFAPGPAFGPQPFQTDQTEGGRPKSATRTDDNSAVSPELRRQELERVVREEASRLQLSSTMVGVNPIAVIQVGGAKGTRAVLGIGDSVDGFELIEVSSRTVILMKDDVRVELSLGRR